MNLLSHFLQLTDLRNLHRWAFMLKEKVGRYHSLHSVAVAELHRPGNKLTVLEAVKSKDEAQASVRVFAMCHNMAERWRAREHMHTPKKEFEGRILFFFLNHCPWIPFSIMTLIQLPLIKSHFPMLFHWGIRFPTHKFVGCFPAIAAGNWAALRSGTLGWQSGGERLKWGGQVIYASHRGTFENRKGMLLIILQCRHESTRTVWVQMEPHGSYWGQCWWTQKNFQAKFRGIEFLLRMLFCVPVVLAG